MAIIMDGNGRWARARGLPRVAGHRRGAEAVRRCVTTAVELGIGYLTLFGFSTENWRRPAGEIKDLMALLRSYLRREIRELHAKGIRFQVVGERGRLPRDIVHLIDEAEALTRCNERLTLTVALSYGGRQEIVAAAVKLARRAASGEIDETEIDESTFANGLMTAGMPDPDLIIRTGGEKRISNFLLWQSAASELVFLDTLWPDFSEDDLKTAVSAHERRRRPLDRLGFDPDAGAYLASD